MGWNFWSHAKTHPRGYREANVEAVERIRGDVRIVDVRQPDEFTGELGHIPGSELVPLETLDQVAAGWKKEETLVLVCRSGARSGMAAEHLAGLGFGHVINMTGGLLAYNAQGYAVERGRTAG